MSRFAIVLLCLVLAFPAWSAPPSASAGEIERLIASLGASGCDFQRNGSWYPAKKAEDHLRRKYEWLRERELAATAEQFIERAGTKSSMSGRAYQVRCSGRPIVTSAEWLRARLAEMRKHDPH
ncbi:DUF5329 domain-containing protein [Lysobacter niabensis]|uniref:DUF5329 domain-containing protein n=1 Tax=Agrilutibacter niabensis TaxID=380628 RepID=UPI00361FCD52